MPRALHAVLLAGLLALGRFAGAEPPGWPTLRELLAQSGQEPPSSAEAPLDARVTSYAVLAEPGLFVLAGYLIHGESQALGPLHVWRYDAETARWSQATIEDAANGSVLSVRRVGRFLLLQMHHSPSSTTDLVLTAALEVHDHLAPDRLQALFPAAPPCRSP